MTLILKEVSLPYLTPYLFITGKLQGSWRAGTVSVFFTAVSPLPSTAADTIGTQ